MIRSLRWRFTAICVLLTGLVVIALGIVSLFMAQAQIINASDALFENTMQTIINKLQLDGSVRDVWLAQTEINGHFIIDIQDEGHPLFFKGSWQPQTEREQLFSHAKAIAKTQYGVDISQRARSSISTTQVRFVFNGEKNEKYQSSVAVIPSGQGWYSVVLLMDLSQQNNALLKARAFYAAITLGAIFLLGMIGWFLAGRAVVPVEKSIQQQTAFVASASHELRSPLAVIKASLSAMDTNPSEEKRLLETVNSEVSRMTRLVDDLLVLANSDAANWSILSDPVDLDTILIETVEQLRPLAKQKAHRLDLELPQDVLPKVIADKERLIQILTILLNNAIEYSTPDTHITVTGEERASHVEIAVIDHGPGIPSESKSKLFDRFYRAEQSRTDKHHFGLGLSIAKELAQLHNGTLTVMDTKGGGSTFVLSLPLK